MGAGYSSWEAERHALILSLLRKDFPGAARVLELGAAPGAQALGLAEAGYHVTAVDIGVASDAWEGAAEGTMAAEFAEAGIELVIWNLDETPYPLAGEDFDAVVMTEVFEHLREYPATALTEVYRILRPGGCLYFTTPNATYVGNRVRLARGQNIATPLRDWIDGVPLARHSREYTFREIDYLLRRAGLQPVLVMGRHLHITSGRTSRGAQVLKRVVDRIARLRPTMGPAIVVVARRPL